MNKFYRSLCALDLVCVILENYVAVLCFKYFEKSLPRKKLESVSYLLMHHGEGLLRNSMSRREQPKFAHRTNA